jgi:hypothetical protein
MKKVILSLIIAGVSSFCCIAASLTVNNNIGEQVQVTLFPAKINPEDNTEIIGDEPIGEATLIDNGNAGIFDFPSEGEYFLSIEYMNNNQIVHEPIHLEDDEQYEVPAQQVEATESLPEQVEREMSPMVEALPSEFGFSQITEIPEEANEYGKEPTEEYAPEEPVQEVEPAAEEPVYEQPSEEVNEE